MAHYVKCYYCNETFDRDKKPCIEIINDKTKNKPRWAHEACAKINGYIKPPEMTQNEQDYLELENYIKKLFKKDYLNAKIINQIYTYKNTYNYSYSGMLKCLKWWYEKEQHQTEDANEGIGIIPFIWDRVYNYYKEIFDVNQYNEEKIVTLNHKTKIVTIPPPSPRISSFSKKEFKLLEEEE